MHWFPRFGRRDDSDRQLDDELQTHIDEDATRLEAEGLTAAEARRVALARFGGLQAIREQTREVRRTRWLDDLVRDLRYAARLMRRSPIFTAAAVGSLAIGIGANTAIFSIVDALVLRALPVAAPHELHVLERGLPGEPPNHRFSYPMLRELQTAVPKASFAGSSWPVTFQLTVDGASELVGGQLVSGNWFEVLGLRAQAGRLLTPADDAAGRPPVVVISDAYWTRRFGRDPAIAGRDVLLNGVPVTIAGIAPRDFHGLVIGTPLRLWAPAWMQHPLRVTANASNHNSDSSEPWSGQPGIRWLSIVARLPPAVAPQAVEAPISALLRQNNEAIFGRDEPDAEARWRRERAWIVGGSHGISPLRQLFSGPLWMLMATVALVLLVSCANLASLLLARHAARVRELTVRLALGAARARLMRQLLTESLLLAALGGLAGLLLARWTAPILPRLALSAPPGSMPLDLPLDWRLFAFAAGTSLLTGALVGLAPALRWSRPALHDSLRPSHRVVGGRQAFARALVVVQVALALVLVVGAALFGRTFRNYLAIDVGFDREQVVTARINPRLAAIDEARLPGLYDRLLQEVARLPGVRGATIAVVGAATGSTRVSTVVVQGFESQGREDSRVHEDFVGPRYFQTIGIPIRRGRDFTTRDDERATPVAIVNETMARQYFGDRDPIGRRFGYSVDNEFEIVGVVADARVNGLRQAPPAMAYFPLTQYPDEYAYNLYVRVAETAGGIHDALRGAIARVEPTVAVREVVTLAELSSRSVALERLISSLMSTFGVIAVVIACLGLFGTLSYSVARRTGEIGVRLALGADPAAVRWMVLRESIALVALGCAAGLVAVLALVRFVSALLFGVSPYDPLTLGIATVAVVLVSFVASAVPAWRASRVDPLAALRAE
jgi:predicted permease